MVPFLYSHVRCSFLKHTTDQRNKDQVPPTASFMNSSTPVVVAWWSLQTKCLVLTAAGILCGPVFPLNWPSDQHSSVQNGNPSCFGTSLLFQLLDSSSGPVLYSFSPPNVWETNYWRGAILVDWRRNEGWRSEGVFLLHVTYSFILVWCDHNTLSMMTITMIIIPKASQTLT